MRKLVYSNCTYYTGADISSFSDCLAYKHYSNIVFITDKNVYSYWNSFFGNNPVIVLYPGESNKNLQTVSEIISDLLARGCDRNSLVVGVGGGVVCDITGFAASVFMRGIDFALVPTTLLAQADASLGGKNGVNIEGFKNIAGTFNLPRFVFSSQQFLSTLPEEEIRNGLCEAIKHGLICDAEYFMFIQSNIDKLIEKNENALLDVVDRSVKIKMGIVAADFYEKGDRQKLNFGHSFGHAIEKRYCLPHGKAVSLGMVIASEISVRTGLCSSEVAEEIISVLGKSGLPADTRNFDMDSLVEIVRSDKKKCSDSINLVLLEGIGRSVIMKIGISNLKEILYE